MCSQLFCSLSVLTPGAEGETSGDGEQTWSVWEAFQSENEDFLGPGTQEKGFCDKLFLMCTPCTDALLTI